VADVLGIVGSAIDTVKKLREVEAKIANAELRNLIGDLNMALADLKIEIADLKDENTRLKVELKQEKERAIQSGQLVAKGALLYFKEPPPDKPVGPYCPNCKGNAGKLMLLEDQRTSGLGGFGDFHCPACDAWFKSSP